MFENGINYFSSWGYLSNGFFEGNPTVSYHVARNAAKFEGSKLCKTTADKKGMIIKAEVGAVSGFNDETDTLHIMAYNFKNKVDYKSAADTKFTVKAPQFDGKQVKVTTYVINDDCNYFDEWVEDRKTYGIGNDCFAWSPDDPTIDNPVTLNDPKARDIYFNELYAKYAECSKHTPTEQTMTVENGELVIETTLDPHEVVFYEITEA